MLYALVDFHNEARSRANRLDNAADYLVLLEAIVADITRSSKAIASGKDELAVRLYSGWYDEATGDKTLDRDLAGAACERINKRGWARFRILPTCADSLLADEDLVLWNTLRTHPRAPQQLRHVYHAAICGRHHPCSMPDLTTWINGRCPQYATCHVRRDDVVGWRGQKMVDAMLASDMFHIGFAQLGPVIIVANDDDYVPSVITARAHGIAVWMLHTNRRHPPAYLDHLNDLEAAEVLQ